MRVLREHFFGRYCVNPSTHHVDAGTVPAMLHVGEVSIPWMLRPRFPALSVKERETLSVGTPWVVCEQFGCESQVFDLQTASSVVSSRILRQCWARREILSCAAETDNGWRRSPCWINHGRPSSVKTTVRILGSSVDDFLCVAETRTLQRGPGELRMDWSMKKTRKVQKSSVWKLVFFLGSKSEINESCVHRADFCQHLSQQQVRQ